MQQFSYRSRIEAPSQVVFDWHKMPGAFERLNPPWNPARILERSGGIANGDRTILEIRLGPLRKKWIAEHRNYIEGQQFQDVQLSGPFASWEHTHLVEPDGENACFLEDRIKYQMPMGALGNTFGSLYTRKQLKRIFAYRHQQTINDIKLFSSHPGAKQKILISGSTGLLASALIPLLQNGGHSITRLVRQQTPQYPGSIEWDPIVRLKDETVLEKFDALIHLAGENIAGRWTADKKRRIYESRIQSVRLLCESMSRLNHPPKTVVLASAIGYYGNRGDEILHESSEPGTDFLAQVCRQWEQAAEPAVKRGIRVVHLRIGVVLTPRGGALQQMLLPFKMGAGGVIGNGRQYISWITIDDLISAIYHVLTKKDIHGPVNLTAPYPVDNRVFTKTLGKVLHRPTLVPLPAFAVKLIFREMGEALLLSSTRVDPARLLETDYEFRYPNLELALRHALGKEDN